jgi:hypothetical protein
MSWEIDEYFNLSYNDQHCGNIYNWINTDDWKYQRLNWAWPVIGNLSITSDEIIRLLNVKHQIMNPKTHRLIEYELKLYNAGMIEERYIILHKGYLLFRYKPAPELEKQEYNIRLVKINEIKELTEWKLIECNNYKENGKIFIMPFDQCKVYIKYNSFYDYLMVKYYRLEFPRRQFKVYNISEMIDQYNALKSFEFGKVLVGDLLKSRLGKYITYDIMSYIVGEDTMKLEKEEGGRPHEIFIVKNPTQKKRKWNFRKMGAAALAAGLLAVGLKRMCF